MRRLRWAVLVTLACPAALLARGRQPDENTDNFPDYNRLEMRPKPKTATQEPTPMTNTPAAGAPAAPAALPTPPALNAPVNTSSDDDVPKPPPKVVPLPDNASEPPLPDDMKDTLIPTTTTQ